MKKAYIYILLFSAVCGGLSCGGNGGPEPDPEPVVPELPELPEIPEDPEIPDDPEPPGPPDEPEPPDEPDSYIRFRFDGRDFLISNDENCIFTRRGDDYYVISGSDATLRQAFTLTVGRAIEPGESYDIYTSSLYAAALIRILFTEGDDLAEENLPSDDAAPPDVIGELSVTELSDSRLSGTFACRTTNGEITDGRFSVRAKEYE
jgi:hypothetical protein